MLETMNAIAQLLGLEIETLDQAKEAIKKAGRTGLITRSECLKLLNYVIDQHRRFDGLLYRE